MNLKKKGLAEKIVNMILDVIIFIFGIILLISIYNTIQVKLLGNDYSSFFGYTIFEVQTGSMVGDREDSINVGDWIIVKADNTIELDDVVTFEQDGAFVTHRVIEKYKGTFITKGDANNAKDDPITQEQIVGRVVKILPLFGIFKKTIFNPVVLIAIIITLYLTSIWLKDGKKGNKEEKVEIDDKKVNLLEKTKKIISEIIENKIKEKQRQLSKEEHGDKKEYVKETKKKQVNKEIEKESFVPVETSVVEELKVEEKEEIIEEVKFKKVTDDVVEEKVSSEDAEIISEEEFDKTMYFRAITVDKDEIDKTFLEIKKNKELEKLEALKAKEKAKEKEKVKKKKEKISLKEEKSETILKEALDLMQIKIKKKFNNVIDKVMYIKEQELNDIIEILNNKKELAVNETTIKNDFISMFIDVKYYNHCGDDNVDYDGRNMTTKIVEAINNLQDSMIKKYSGSDNKYDAKVKKYANIFILIMYLEQARGTIEDADIIKEMYKKRITKYSDCEYNELQVKDMINDILKVQRLYQSMTNYTLEKLETKMFNLEYNSITNKKNLYGLELKHNINFSKVYSDYIVDKTYSEGIIAEDKMTILITLLSMRLAKDMLNSEFKNKYILYMPNTLYSKDNKLGQLSKIMDNELIKNSVIILSKYEDFVSNKQIIKGLKKEGYKFALGFDKDVEIKAKNQSTIYLADYIFVDKKTANIKEILKNIPDELKNDVIEDNISSKVGNYGGE